MLTRLRRLARRPAHHTLRMFLSWLPRKQRFRVFRSFVDCNPSPSKRLVLKLAETREELEACFAVLHDAYVDSGFMKPDPSGMRVTIYHALPTTSILCAKYDGEVVGTISLIRESALGVPLQASQPFDGVLQPGRHGRAIHKFNVLLDKVESRLEIGEVNQQLLPQGTHPGGNAARQLVERLLKLPDRTGVDHAEDRFRLHEVDLSCQKRP